MEFRDQKRKQKKNKKKMSVTPNSNLDSPPNNGEVRDQNSLSSSSAQTLNYDRHPPPPPPFTQPNLQNNPHPPPSSANPPPPGPILYRECLKNHAAAVGGHVVDGCGEFMPAGEDGTPESLKCAACDCHRNFHRRVDHPNLMNSVVYNYGGGGSFHHPPVSYYSNSGKNHHIVTTTHSRPTPPPLSLIPDHHQSRPGPALPVMMAFGGCNTNGGGADSSSSEEDLRNVFRSDSGGRMGVGSDKINYYCTEAEGSSGKKRFRTKFTAEQKDKMMEFAEKLGWKISKQDEHDLARFCAEMGFKRQVFKVWMHNSKQALKKKKNHHFDQDQD